MAQTAFFKAVLRPLLKRAKRDLLPRPKNCKRLTLFLTKFFIDEVSLNKQVKS